jgi:hypothetical protein
MYITISVMDRKHSSVVMTQNLQFLSTPVGGQGVAEVPATPDRQPLNPYRQTSVLVASNDRFDNGFIY